MSVLDDQAVRELVRDAWHESQPGTDPAHEEGGFVLRKTDGSLVVQRWPRGEQNEIAVLAYVGGTWNGLPIVATFHTHPNPGPHFQQEPSATDIRAVRDDPHLNHSDYEGEYVIATEEVFQIRRSGQIEIVGKTRAVLNIT